MTSAGRVETPSRTGIQSRSAKPDSGDRMTGALSHAALAIWTLLVVLPLLWTVLSSFKTTSEIFASPFALPKS